MKLDSLCSHPEILSNITFLMNNYKVGNKGKVRKVFVKE